MSNYIFLFWLCLKCIGTQFILLVPAPPSNSFFAALGFVYYTLYLYLSYPLLGRDEEMFLTAILFIAVSQFSYKDSITFRLALKDLLSQAFHVTGSSQRIWKTFGSHSFSPQRTLTTDPRETMSRHCVVEARESSEADKKKL